MSRFFILILLFFCLCPLSIHASSNWVEKDSGTLQSVRSITQMDDGTLVVVGNSGHTMYSIDHGETWTAPEPSSHVFWYDVVNNPAGGVDAVGESGIYVTSLDYGATWKQTSLDTSAFLFSIDRSENFGYITGSQGVLFYFANNNWHSATTDVDDLLLSVQDMGNGQAWVVGGRGRILHLTNAGTSVKNMGAITSHDLRGVHFVSDTIGWAVGDYGTFKKTTDAGVSWSDVAVSGLSTQDLYDMTAFGDHLIVAGNKIMLSSVDGGSTWTSEDFTQENLSFFGVSYKDEQNLWIIGSNEDVVSSVFLYVPDQSISTEPLSQEITPTTTESLSSTLNTLTSHLVKLACPPANADVNDPCKAVYYYATDGYRHAFPNEKVFFTWFENFDDIEEIEGNVLSSMPLGPTVTYHPGTRMVKFQSVPTVYAVERTGVLRAIASEAVAEALYGPQWNQHIDDISDAFFGNYSFGEKIESSTDYAKDEIWASVSSLDDNF